MEFVFILSLVLALTVFSIAIAFREMELNMVLTAVRTSGEKIALENNVVLQKIDYSVNGNSVSVNPVFSAPPSNPPDWKSMLFNQTKEVVSPNSAFNASQAYCFPASKTYCLFQ